jgi:two-component system, NarL family, nitrate/nitrite response regulator NarL
MITTVAIITRLRVFQELLASLIGSRPGFAVIAISESEADARRAVAAKLPDVALVDASLPGVWNVTEAAHRSGARVVLFGLSDDPRPLEAATNSGCAQTLRIGATSRELIDALDGIRSVETRAPDQPAEAHIVASLTSREYQVLQLVAQGLSNKEIATALTVSLPTVKSHVHNVLGKLGTRRRLDAGRLLHVAACDASVQPPALRELGIDTTRRPMSLAAARAARR